MPERKRLIGSGRGAAQYVADVALISRLSAARIKNGPEKLGPFVRSIKPGNTQRKRVAALEVFNLRASEAEIGKISVADGGAGAGHQQAVNGGHQAAEQIAG